MEELERGGQDFPEHPPDRRRPVASLLGQGELGALQVAVAEVVPDEVVQAEGGFVEVEAGERRRTALDGQVQPVENAAVVQGEEVGMGAGVGDLPSASRPATKRAAFQSLLAKLRPSSQRALE